MFEGLSPGRRSGLIAAKIVCCGGLLAFAIGGVTLGGIGAWLSDGGFYWLGSATLGLTGLILWGRRRGDKAEVPVLRAGTGRLE